MRGRQTLHACFYEAHPSAKVKKPTNEFEDIINKGRFTMRLLQGSVPLVHERHVVGAIGVSGVKSAARDKEVAKAGADALAAKKVAARSRGIQFRARASRV